MSEPLTEEQFDALHRRLKDLTEEIESALETSSDSERPVDLEEPIGRISRIDAIQQQKMARASRARLQGRLRAIRAALDRIDQDAYGDCALCDDPIGYGRLAARPETPLCMPCQSERE
ncbi:MAG: molecular chaperone DnaK [Deltaproteobacteria bacterium]|nr:molecular chaperone DnaK [Deltaproteobacteria bacterium]